MKKLTQFESSKLYGGKKHIHKICKKSGGWFVYCYTIYS